MNYSEESLYDVFENVLIRKIKDEWLWNNPQDRHDLIVKHSIKIRRKTRFRK